MNSTRSLFAALALSLAMGCAHDDTPDAPTTCDAPEATTDALMTNGIMVNGIVLNAMNFNGILINGIMLNGPDLVQGVIVGGASRGDILETGSA